MKKPATHRAEVINRNTGERRKVKVRESAETWIVGQRESYYKNTGKRAGCLAGSTMIQLDLSSIRPIGGENV